MRLIAGDGQTLRSGRVRGIRLLRLPLTLLLGTAAAPALHPARPAGRLRAHRAKADERTTLLAMLDVAPVPVADGQVIMADKGYNGTWLEDELNNGGVELIRPARKGESPGQASNS